CNKGRDSSQRAHHLAYQKPPLSETALCSVRVSFFFGRVQRPDTCPSELCGWYHFPMQRRSKNAYFCKSSSGIANTQAPESYALEDSPIGMKCRGEGPDNSSSARPRHLLTVTFVVTVNLEECSPSTMLIRQGCSVNFQLLILLRHYQMGDQVSRYVSLSVQTKMLQRRQGGKRTGIEDSWLELPMSMMLDTGGAREHLWARQGKGKENQI
ncbi:hypothetical protein STEG23_003490, partial [Scotinomys teguina]